ncbi:LacI family DNA-binding transcriptional regulator [Enterococcus casseliflavus]|nr:LacI family DNA-binding transcriptional regulator [Enterococcus casseliflavus]
MIEESALIEGGNGKYQDVAKLANGSVNTVLRVINKKIHE